MPPPLILLALMAPPPRLVVRLDQRGSYRARISLPSECDCSSDRKSDTSDVPECPFVSVTATSDGHLRLRMSSARPRPFSMRETRRWALRNRKSSRGPTRLALARWVRWAPVCGRVGRDCVPSSRSTSGKSMLDARRGIEPARAASESFEEAADSDVAAPLLSAPGAALSRAGGAGDCRVRSATRGKARARRQIVVDLRRGPPHGAPEIFTIQMFLSGQREKKVNIMYETLESRNGH